MSGEERMTRDEWRSNEARQECANFGHEWTIIQIGAQIPIRLICERPCGSPGYVITPADQGGQS